MLNNERLAPALSTKFDTCFQYTSAHLNINKDYWLFVVLIRNISRFKFISHILYNNSDLNLFTLRCVAINDCQ